MTRRNGLLLGGGGAGMFVLNISCRRIAIMIPHQILNSENWGFGEMIRVYSLNAGVNLRKVLSSFSTYSLIVI